MRELLLVCLVSSPVHAGIMAGVSGDDLTCEGTTCPDVLDPATYEVATAFTEDFGMVSVLADFGGRKDTFLLSQFDQPVQNQRYFIGDGELELILNGSTDVALTHENFYDVIDTFEVGWFHPDFNDPIAPTAKLVAEGTPQPIDIPEPWAIVLFLTGVGLMTSIRAR